MATGQKNVKDYVDDIIVQSLILFVLLILRIPILAIEKKEENEKTI